MPAKKDARRTLQHGAGVEDPQLVTGSSPAPKPPTVPPNPPPPVPAPPKE